MLVIRSTEELLRHLKQRHEMVEKAASNPVHPSYRKQSRFYANGLAEAVEAVEALIAYEQEVVEEEADSADILPGVEWTVKDILEREG